MLLHKVGLSCQFLQFEPMFKIYLFYICHVNLELQNAYSDLWLVPSVSDYRHLQTTSLKISSFYFFSKSNTHGLIV